MPEFHLTRFGKYLLLEKLAVGGMAQLYRAKITGIQGFEKLIAFKTILPHLIGEKELITSFIDEAKLAALLHHQNIVQIYDFGSMEDSYFIAMEYLFGKDLRHIFTKSHERNLPLSNEHALHITTRICSALDYAHTLKDFQGKPLNIVHRDVSPQNIFVTYEGEVKIVDFGIAKAASQSTITQYGMIKGKIAYMSPEQASGVTIDHRSDVFSTGIILYEMVTGKRMFTGADTLQILAKVSRAEFEPPEVARTGLSPEVYKILNKALMKKPEDRYQSCGEMLADLEEYMFQLSLRPTARGLSQYMKELFKEEIATEENMIREGAVPEVGHPSEPEKEVKLVGEVQPKPELASEGQDLNILKQKSILNKTLKQRSFLYAGVAVVLVAIVVVFAFWFKGKPVTTPGKGVSVKDVQSSGPETSGKTAPSKGLPKTDKETEKGPSPVEKAKALQNEAAALMEKNPNEAKSLLIKAIELDPNSLQNYFLLGSACMKLKDYPKAIENFQKAADLDPKFPDSFFNLGYLYAMKKDYSKAEEMYDRVVKLSPPYLDEALCNLGMVQEKQGKRTQSIENFQRALSVNPKNEMAREFLDKLRKKS